jgi:TP901 family phage tail tape measure protein
MANKEISIVLRAKNAMAAGLSSAKESLEKVGKTAVHVSKTMAKAAAAGIAAMGAAFVKSMHSAQEFNKQMAQVATISDIKMSDARNAVMRLSAALGATKEELTKGLYDALSAGVPKENALTFLEVAAKTAKAGATSTASAVDFLTTAINAFKIPASDAESISDALFTTVRLGKTTVEELAHSFSTVAPIASASGVAFDEVLAATATLTKQGTPTAQAMTQIRAAILSMNEHLGDGWSATMTLQEGMQAMSDKAGGSQVALRNLTGRVEGMQGILGITGANAQMAASDLAELARSAGATGKAFAEVNNINPFDRLKESIHNVMIVAGDVAIQHLGKYIHAAADKAHEFAGAISRWADNGGVAEVIKSINDAVSEFVIKIKDVWNARFDAAFAAITVAVTALIVKLTLLSQTNTALLMTTSQAAKAILAKAAAMKIAAAAATGATAKIIIMKAALVALSAVPLVALVAGFAAVTKAVMENNKATNQLKRSMDDLQDQERAMSDEWGIRSPAAFKKFREGMRSADADIRRQTENTFPKAAARWKELHENIHESTETIEDQKESVDDLGSAFRKIAQDIAQAQKAAGDEAEAAKKAAEEKAEAEKKAQEEIKKARRDAEDALKDQHDREVKEARKAHAKEAKAAEDAQRKRIKDAEKELDAQKKLAETRVKDFIAAQQAQRDEQKDIAREALRMAELQARKDRGIKLSRGQQEQLDAFNAIRKAQEVGVKDAQQRLDDHQRELERLQEANGEKLDKQIKELETINKNLIENLKMG